MHRIIFICTGNVCRSPMAEGILRARWAALDRTDLIVSSMGIHGLNHQSATSLSLQVCAENSIDISGHISRQLDFDEISASDLLFTMEMIHKNFILLFFPHLVDRVFLLGAWPQSESSKHNIKDPMGKGPKHFRRAFETIANNIDRIIPDLQNYFE